ncbi:MAG: HPF/RaiA family ribosome-associated protein [Rhodanobacteraceae bacterium]|nr:HPF/RaiA family ribosome-associated protein [Rhodanobacteraceae bacterium]
MRIDIQAQGFALTQSIQSHVQRRIEFALDRLRGRVRRVCVRLSDVNGRRGGIDKRCQLQVQLADTRDVVVADVQRDLYVAMTRAVDRAAAAIVRRIGRLNRARTTALPARPPAREILRLRRPAMEQPA